MLLISNENRDEVFSSVIFDENNNELCYVGNFWFCKKNKKWTKNSSKNLHAMTYRHNISISKCK